MKIVNRDQAAIINVADEVRDVGAGDAIFIPRHPLHSLTNIGTESMVLSRVCGPAFRQADHLMEAKGG